MTKESEHSDLMADISLRAAAAGRQWRPGIQVDNVRPLTGGTSSLTFIADISDGDSAEPVVLKVAPPGLEPVRNRDVIRQGRVMKALQGVPGVAAPAVHFEDAAAPPVRGDANGSWGMCGTAPGCGPSARRGDASANSRAIPRCRADAGASPFGAPGRHRTRQ